MIKICDTKCSMCLLLKKYWWGFIVIFILGLLIRLSNDGWIIVFWNEPSMKALIVFNHFIK